MDRRTLLLGTLALPLTLPLARAVVRPARAEIDEMTLQVAHIYDPGNLWYEATQRYLDAVTKATGGKVKFNVAASGTTGTWQESIEALPLGTNDIVIQSVGTLDRYDPLPGIEAFPYLIRDLDHFKKVYYGPIGGELYGDIEKKTGFKIVGAGYRGARKLSANRKVVTLDDLKGLKLRVPPLKMYKRTWELLGASPVPMPFLEVFTALQQGVIDGQENPLEVIESKKLDEVQKYVMATDHVIGAMTFIFDSKRFASFPPELQKILQEEGEKAMLWATAEMVKQEDSYRQKLKARGMEFVKPDLPAFRKAVAPIKDEFPELKSWVERVQAA
ncbi:tripartite ATP-independent transporter solute receptor, DctP family [Tistlia consotensis]|uniref:Tripartite ATP-independent transporter solute receptor, DctP family n=1 Tax=Tistlia consotensis USBA 355 TaxID=560819 RepID=A0A1Y6B8H1_9PROT|nr:TRAP transporter substrate-binding protein [Tistlia consotensis]SME89910.1 tripartite ATP-independent transporter solute receptor, DctP family [Tistlia consotensis USBA 355]SNR26416.1 tripartite ATP-independent transporter solute receptor, DctP family [Tistlia consotensis]